MRLVARETTGENDNRHTSLPNQAGPVLGSCLFFFAIRCLWYFFVPQTFSLRFVLSESRIIAEDTEVRGLYVLGAQSFFTGQVDRFVYFLGMCPESG